MPVGLLFIVSIQQAVAGPFLQVCCEAGNAKSPGEWSPASPCESAAFSGFCLAP